MLQLGNKITVGEPIYKFQNNHSVDFDGVDDFIQLGQGFTYTQHTVSAWIKLSSLSNTHTILSGRDSSTDLIRFWVASSDNKVRFRLGDGSNSTVTNPTALEADRWYHVVATYDGTNIKIYVDSVLGHSLAASKNVDVTANLKIGEDDDDNNMHGKIDELAIYDRALTAAEVTEIYRIKYGANLVQNGRFDELGSELVTNGTFDSTDNWSTPTGWNISDGKLKGTNVNAVSATQGSHTFLNKSFKVVYTVSDYVQGDVRIYLGGTQQTPNRSANGTYTEYITITTANTTLYIQGINNFTGSIDNVSVKQVDPNDRFTLGTGFSFGDSKVIFSGTDYSSLTTTSNLLTSGKTYRVNLSAAVTNGSFKLQNGGVDVITGSATNNYSAIFTSNSNTFNISRAGVGIQNDFTITNLMIEEQKYVATNLKLNSGNYKSADPVIVSTKSIEFDGSDAYLEVTKKDFLGTSDFTISLWIRPDTVSANNYIIGQSTDDDTRWYIRVNTLANVQMFRKSGGTTFNLQGGAVVLNEWNHIVVTADRDASAIAYLNGVRVHSQSGNSHDLTTTGNLRIGSFEHFDEYFDGTIDEVGIFNTALSSDQVGELYNQGVPSNLATSSAGIDGALVGYWKMGDGTLDEAPLIADQTNATLGSELITEPLNLNSNFQNNGGGIIVDNDTFTTAGGSFDGITSPSSFLVTGKTYKLIIAGNTTSSGFTIGNQVLSGNEYGAGFGTHYFVASGDRLWIRQQTAGTTNITSFSVKQVNGNPALMINTPTIVTDAPLTKIRNYYRMGDGILDTHPLICDMVEPSLGSDVITNGDFNGNADNWTLQNAEYQEGSNNVKLTKPSSGNAVIFQTGLSFEEGQILRYKFKFVSFTGSPNIRIDGFSGSNPLNTLTDFAASGGDVDTYVKTDRAGSGVFLYIVGGSVGDTVVIDDVSVQIVNGVPGFMTNMTEADITNDVPS